MSEYKLGFNRAKISEIFYAELVKLLDSTSFLDHENDQDVTDILDSLGLLAIIENIETQYSISLDGFNFEKFPPMKVEDIVEEIFRVLS